MCFLLLFEAFSNYNKKKKMTIATNKKAYHQYQVVEKLEAGIGLLGAEIKAIRAGKVDLTGSYVRVLKEELWWLGGQIETEEPSRSRKLLVHRKEIKRLMGKTQEKGLTLVPLRLYLKKGRAKLEIGLAKGRKLWDQREEIKKRDADREIRQRDF
ncbi:SsrA-binding protein SmpB [Candidatus Berkelbacteria bacterium]|nr:SsrA-binding protein SmpB [Candidatus Berkelbacteria bacterium]